jgi:hypothetical protein
MAALQNVFEIEVDEGGVVEFSVLHCRVSLNDTTSAARCVSAAMFALNLFPNGGIIEGCLRNGCQFHTLRLSAALNWFDRAVRQPIRWTPICNGTRTGSTTSSGFRCGMSPSSAGRIVGKSR